MIFWLFALSSLILSIWMSIMIYRYLNERDRKHQLLLDEDFLFPSSNASKSQWRNSIENDDEDDDDDDDDEDEDESDEEDCVQQIAALEEASNLRAQIQQLQAMIDTHNAGDEAVHKIKLLKKRVKRVDCEANRPLSSRLSDVENTPSQVTEALSALRFAEISELRRAKRLDAFGITQLVTSTTQHIRYNLLLTMSSPNMALKLATMQWRDSMSDWSPTYWAWFCVLVFRKICLVPRQVSLSYKLQRKPFTDSNAFLRHVENACIDLLFVNPQMKWCLGEDLVFVPSINGISMNRSNDIALAFDDEKTLLWVNQLGFDLQDYSANPARSYMRPNSKNLLVIDSKENTFEGAFEYIKCRLSHANHDVALSIINDDEATRRITFIYRLLIALSQSNQKVPHEIFKEYDAYSKTLQQQCSMRFAEETSLWPKKSNAARCFVCGITEENSAKLKHCVCGGADALYCGTICQKKHWKTHKSVCKVWLSKNNTNKNM